MKINSFSPEAFKIFEVLHKKGYEVFVVGGFIRDTILGIPCTDIDIVTNAFPDQIIKLFPNDKIDLVGKSFGVVLINNIEVASYRNDRYFGLSDKKVEISVGTIETDAARRDLTINSVFFDPIREVIFDPNGGMEDIRNKIIKFVGNPKDRIFEDPNRIIRICRFKSQINGIFDSKTLDSLKEFAHFLDAHVTSERVRIEILKAMKIKKASKFFEALKQIGALEFIFKSLTECNVDGGQHHRETVFEHSMLVGDAISCKYPLLKLSGYLHDLGKPAAKGINPLTGEAWFKGHEDTGAELAKGNLEVLKFSNDEVNYIFNVIRMHMRISDRMEGKAIRRLLKDCKEARIEWSDLIRLWMADHAGNKRVGVDRSLERYKALVSKFWKESGRVNLPLSVTDLAITGNDIMEILKISPGQKVGEVLKFALDAIIDCPEGNEYNALVCLIRENFLKDGIE